MLKEQIIHGRIYRNIAELRNAVRGAGDNEQYNAQWIVEKNGPGPAKLVRRGTPRCHSGAACDKLARPRNRVAIQDRYSAPSNSHNCVAWKLIM